MTAHAAADPEHELVLEAQRCDPLARERLVESFMPLIGSVAHLYRGQRAVERAELLQAGVLGVLRALDRYDPTLGTPFWAYATWWVRQAMQRLVAELSRPVVLSDRALRELARVRDARAEHAQSHGRQPSTIELAEATGLPLDRLDSLLVADNQPRWLHEEVGGAPEGRAVLQEMLSDPRAEEAYDEVVIQFDVEQIPELLRTLNERERHVVCAHYGLGAEPATLREIAGGLGVTPERVRQIEQGALERLREAATPAEAPHRKQ
jgi:RNA polymerase sigma factor (sigma-70 family)